MLIGSQRTIEQCMMLISLFFLGISPAAAEDLSGAYIRLGRNRRYVESEERRVIMAEIPIQSRLDKSLKNTRTFLNKSINVVNEGNDKHEHLSLLMENQRIEDAYLIKESESKIQV
jgi:hypothetical protein